MTAISMEQPHAETHQSAPADGLEMTVFDREHRNRLQSRICALPEELVLEIMSCMRLTELYLTRQVSHLFFRLSGAIPFRELRFPKESDSASNFYNRYRYNDNRHVLSHSQPVFNATQPMRFF
ncbi:hypothetical protein CGCF413_v010904 [Colletotrichum fructicola]|nr:hypothetical protein CGCF413_v010904 [Colletotrichum fructicola]